MRASIKLFTFAQACLNTGMTFPAPTCTARLLLAPITQVFDLLSKLLVYDHHARLTCSEAMQHPYFAPVRAAEAAAAAATAAAAGSSGGAGAVRCLAGDGAGTSTGSTHTVQAAAGLLLPEPARA